MPTTLATCRAAVDRESDPAHRAPALERLADHIEALVATVRGPGARKAQQVADQRLELARTIVMAETARQNLRDGFHAVYRDPEAAEGAWRKILENHSLNEATRILTLNPAILGPFRGTRSLFGLIKDQDCREARAKSTDLARLANQHQALADRVIVGEATEHQLDQAERGPEIQAVYRAWAELGPGLLRDLERGKSLSDPIRKEAADLRIEIEQTEIRDLVETHRKRIIPLSISQLQIVGLETHQQTLLAKHGNFSQAAMAEAWRVVARTAFVTWQAAKVVSQQERPAVQRSRHRGMSPGR